ncbi:MAG: hypothetical protein WD010_01230, partial [Nitriliruptor sp.]
MKPGQRLLRGPLPWILAFAAALWLGVSFLGAANAPDELSWTEFSAAVEAGQLQGQDLELSTIGNRSQSIEGERIVDGDATPFRVVYNPDIVGDQIGSWIDAGQLRTEFDAEAPGALTSILATVLPFILILGIFFLLMNNMQGGGGKVMQFGKSKAKMVSKD